MSNASSRPHIIPADVPVNDDQSSRGHARNAQRSQGHPKLSRSKRERQAIRRCARLESRRARRSCKAKEGISTGPDFIVFPELEWLRRSRLYLNLPSSVCREELNQSIEKKIVEEGLEDRTSWRLGRTTMRKLGTTSHFPTTKVSGSAMPNLINQLPQSVRDSSVFESSSNLIALVQVVNTSTALGTK